MQVLESKFWLPQLLYTPGKITKYHIDFLIRGSSQQAELNALNSSSDQSTAQNCTQVVDLQISNKHDKTARQFKSLNYQTIQQSVNGTLDFHMINQ